MNSYVLITTLVIGQVTLNELLGRFLGVIIPISYAGACMALLAAGFSFSRGRHDEAWQALVAGLFVAGAVIIMNLLFKIAGLEPMVPTPIAN